MLTVEITCISGSKHTKTSILFVGGLNSNGHLYGTVFGCGQPAAEQRKFVVQYISANKGVIRNKVNRK